MGLFGKVSENDSFVILMQVARDDQDVKKRLLAILEQNRFNRLSILNTYIKDMLLKSAPADFVAALSYLKDDAVAKKALELIKTI
ncbi:MAG: hypothetical protein KDD94_04760 [Calditrichaeota bacterium]|nr:hypothetical protein [Calditrichota bacterium]